MRSPRFYGRVKGRPLSQLASRRMREMLPTLSVGALPEDGGSLDVKALFPNASDDVWLEVGFGAGEHIARLATLYPKVGIIGSEVFQQGVACLLGHIAQGEQANIRIFPEDVRRLLPCLPLGSLGRVMVLFPDPWPKTRHAKRRFINPDTLSVLSGLMRAGAELRIGSDDPTYQDWALSHCENHPDFAKEQVTNDRSALPADWPVTRYEQKLLAKHPPLFLRYRRV